MNTRHREKETTTDMSSQKLQRKEPKVTRNDEGKTGPKQLTLTEAMAKEATTATQTMEVANQVNLENELLAELRKLRQENATSFQELKDSSNRLETKMEELKQKTEGLDQRLTEVETRVSEVEHGHMRHERALGYLLRKEAYLSNKCDDIENRIRRKNMRIYGIPERAEKDDMISFVTNFLKGSLTLQDGLNIELERAHRALGQRPSDTAPPRSIIVRFWDFRVKQTVLQQAWKQRDVQFQGNRVYFDQDYSPEVQRKRKKVREVIKKLKERNVKAQSPYPAQLRIFFTSGPKVFSSLLEARSTLEELGINVEMDDREILEMEMASNHWTTQLGGRRRDQYQLKASEIRSFIQEG